MVWTIEFEPLAERQLDKLDPSISQRLIRFLEQRVAPLKNPRDLGEPLTGERMGALWRYRVGDYRIIVHIEDKRILVRVVQVGHRRDIYRKF